MASRRRVICPACDRSVAVKQDDTFQVHQSWYLEEGRLCGKSRRLVPVEHRFYA